METMPTEIEEKESDKTITIGVWVAVVFTILGLFVNTLNTKTVTVVQEPLPPQEISYVVAEDEKFIWTVWDIAMKHYPHTDIISTWELIRNANELDDFDLKKGDVLILPDVEVTANEP